MDTVTLAIALSKIWQVKKELSKEGFKIQVEHDRSILNRAGQEKTFYLLPKEKSDNNENLDNYDEYVYANKNWEKVGSTGINGLYTFAVQENEQLLSIQQK